MRAQAIRRGDIFFAELPRGTGSVYYGVRPVLIISNNSNNTYSHTVTAIPLTSKNKNHLPTHVIIPAENGLRVDSTVMCENICNYSTDILREKITAIDENSFVMKKIEKAVRIQLGIA